MAVDYYDAYRAGYRAGEIDDELGSSCGPDHFIPPAPGANPLAWQEALLWGYGDAMDGISGMRSPASVEMHLDSEFAI